MPMKVMKLEIYNELTVEELTQRTVMQNRPLTLTNTKCQGKNEDENLNEKRTASLKLKGTVTAVVTQGHSNCSVTQGHSN